MTRDDDEVIYLRIPRRLKRRAEKIAQREVKYASLSHFVRCVLEKAIKEHEQEI